VSHGRIDRDGSPQRYRLVPQMVYTPMP
jgi:hypothetical protein